jgi:hypothetical protein
MFLCVGSGHAIGQSNSTFVILLTLIYIIMHICNIFYPIDILTFCLTHLQAFLIPILEEMPNPQLLI